MTGAGKAYPLCGAMWDDEFKLCTNVAGHFGTVREGKFGLAKVRCNCKRIGCPKCYARATYPIIFTINVIILHPYARASELLALI